MGGQYGIARNTRTDAGCDQKDSPGRCEKFVCGNVGLTEINAEIITPRFEDGKNGQYKVVSFYAKKARGLMVRFAAENQLTTAQQLKDFNLEGYQFVENASSTTEYVFRRDNK